MEEKTSLQKKEFPKTSISSKTGLNMAFIPYFLVQANFPYAQLPERKFDIVFVFSGRLAVRVYSPARDFFYCDGSNPEKNKRNLFRRIPF